MSILPFYLSRHVLVERALGSCASRDQRPEPPKARFESPALKPRFALSAGHLSTPPPHFHLAPSRAQHPYLTPYLPTCSHSIQPQTSAVKKPSTFFGSPPLLHSPLFFLCLPDLESIYRSSSSSENDAAGHHRALDPVGGLCAVGGGVRGDHRPWRGLAAR